MVRIFLSMMLVVFFLSSCRTSKSVSNVEWLISETGTSDDEKTLKDLFAAEYRKNILKSKPKSISVIIYPLLVDSMGNGIFYYSVCFLNGNPCYSVRGVVLYYLLLKKDKYTYLYNDNKQKNRRLLSKESAYFDKLFGEKWLYYKEELLKGYILINH